MPITALLILYERSHLKWGHIQMRHIMVNQIGGEYSGDRIMKNYQPSSPNMIQIWYFGLHQALMRIFWKSKMVDFVKLMRRIYQATIKRAFHPKTIIRIFQELFLGQLTHRKVPVKIQIKGRIATSPRFEKI